MPYALVIKHPPIGDWELLLNSIYKRKKSILNIKQLLIFWGSDKLLYLYVHLKSVASSFLRIGFHYLRQWVMVN